jgi:hypothetical protein
MSDNKKRKTIGTVPEEMYPGLEVAMLGLGVPIVQGSKTWSGLRRVCVMVERGCNCTETLGRVAGMVDMYKHLSSVGVEESDG